MCFFGVGQRCQTDDVNRAFGRYFASKLFVLKFGFVACKIAVIYADFPNEIPVVISSVYT